MANTPNIDLVKPAGTDHALVSVLNSNSDKIDTFAGTTNAAIANKADKSDVSSICKVGAIQYLTSSDPVSVTPATTLSIVCGQYGTNGFMYMIFRASSTNASACPIKTDSNITVASSNGVITFSNSSGNSYRVQVISLYTA
jgi:hypothetical protein